MIVSGDNWANAPCFLIKASVASTPGPPALVKMVNLLPLGRGCFANNSVILKRSWMVSTRSTPQRRKAASKTSSLPAKVPVCEAVALAASPVRPPLITIIGLLKATSLAAERKERASPIDSIYMAILVVAGSSPR